MKNFSVYLILFLSTLNFAFSQKINIDHISGENYKSQYHEFQKIALDILKSQSIDSTNQYYYSNFHLLLLAEKFEEARSAVDNYIETYSIKRLKEGSVLIFQVYADAHILQNNSDKNFKSAFEVSFRKRYSELDNIHKPEVERSINPYVSINDMEEKFLILLNKYKKKKEISLAEGKNLCLTFLSLKVYSEVLKNALQYLKEEDAQLFEIEENITIKISEGIKVAAIAIKLKENKKKLPAIFVYNIYAGSYDYEIAKRAAVNGYLGVVVNTRGKKINNYQVAPFENDALDAYSIIEWISNYKWCNGEIGMLGGSYLGFSQWSSVKKMHPALKTIVPQVSVGIGIDYPMQKNIFMGYMLQWINYVSNNRFTDEKTFNSNTWEDVYDTYYLKGLAFNKLDSIWNGEKNYTFQRWLKHPNYDSYWKNMVPQKTEYKNINIPILTTTGYYDADQMGALHYFKEHYKSNPDANHYLVIGPYSHGGGQHYPTKTINGYTIDKTALISIHELAFQWFDYIFKGQKKPSILKNKINYQVMDANRWEHTNSFQDMNSEQMSFYLNNVTNGNNYLLKNKKSQQKGYINYEIDLSKRDKEDLHSFIYNPIISSEIASENSLQFISEPFQEEMSINGFINGNFTVASNKRDFDLKLKLFEIKPDGTYFFLTEYISRVSYARNSEKRVLLEPLKDYTFPIKNSFMISKRLNKGSRLLLSVGILKSKYWEINYGTGKPVNIETIKDAGAPLIVKIKNNSYIQLGGNKEIIKN